MLYLLFMFIKFTIISNHDVIMIVLAWYLINKLYFLFAVSLTACVSLLPVLLLD